MKVMFLDESGDHSLDVIDPQYPMFVLVGAILDQDYAETVLERLFDRFKQDLFGRTEIILHRADITRKRNGFEPLADASFRQRFWRDLNRLVASIDFTLVACAIQKEEHLARYGMVAWDPYLLSLEVLVERFCFEVGEVPGGGVIVAERRNPDLDNRLELAFLNLKVQGTRFVQASQIGQRIAGLTLRSKRDNLAGLQLADLMATPIGRGLLGKKDLQDYEIIVSKFRKSRSGVVSGYGLIKLPKPPKK